MEMVYLAAGLMALFYLIMTPVRAGAAWRTGQPVRMGVTIGPFRFTAHGEMKYVIGAGLIASMTHDTSGKQRELSLMRSSADSAALISSIAALSRPLKYLFRHVKPWRLQVHVRFAFPGADRTALMWGFSKALLSALRAARPDLPLSASVSADFRSGHTQADLCGILSCRLGHIMAAGLIWCRDYLCRRFHTWTQDNPSKAS